MVSQLIRSPIYQFTSFPIYQYRAGGEPEDYLAGEVQVHAVLFSVYSRSHFLRQQRGHPAPVATDDAVGAIAVVGGENGLVWVRAAFAHLEYQSCQLVRVHLRAHLGRVFPERT